MDYVERVLEVAKAYDHTNMPISVSELREAYEPLRKRIEDLEALLRDAEEEIRYLREGK